MEEHKPDKTCQALSAACEMAEVHIYELRDILQRAG